MIAFAPRTPVCYVFDDQFYRLIAWKGGNKRTLKSRAFEMEDVNAPEVAIRSSEVELPLVPCDGFTMHKALVITIALLNESISASFLFPFVPLLIAHITGHSPNQSGYISGCLVGVFQLGQVVSAKMWGFCSDRFGRRGPLLTGLGFSGIFSLMFGFAATIPALVALRFFHGLFSGNIIVIKAIISDVTDDTNISQGVALINIAWDIGTIIGPVIGGLLYDPSKSLVLSFAHIQVDDALGSRPQLLASCVVSCCAFITCGLCYCLLPETNVRKTPFSIDALIPHFWKAKRSSLLEADGENDVQPSERSQETFGYRETFSYAPTRYATIVYVLLSASDIGFLEIFPLWSVSTRDSGGLNFNSQTLGSIMLLSAFPSIAANMMFHRFHAKLGSANLWKLTASVGFISFVLTPACTFFDAPFAAVTVLQLARATSIAVAFTLVLLLIVQMSPPQHVGATSGITQSCAATIRAVTPVLMAPLFAWSIASPHPFPFNHFFAFIVLALPLAASIVFIRKTAEGKKRDRECAASVVPMEQQHQGSSMDDVRLRFASGSAQ